jgi:hypothetical protein
MLNTFFKLCTSRLSCKLGVVRCEVGVGVGWCDLGGWHTKLELQSLQSMYSITSIKFMHRS